MKKVILGIATAVLFTINSNAQLRVHSDGNVAVGGDLSNTGYAMTVHGYSALCVKNGSSFCRVTPHQNNVIIGGEQINDWIAFWDASTSYIRLACQAVWEGSDRKLKTDIQPLTDYENLLKLKSHSYYLKSDLENGERRLYYGFIAQEVQELFPHLVDSSMGNLVMNYTEIIPLLVTGFQDQYKIVQEQKNEIDQLNKQISELNDIVVKLARHTGYDISNDYSEPSAVLYQNKPNPFKERTTINYELPKTFNSASIMIFDMTGELLQQHPVSLRDDGQLIIEGSEFKAGMYLYSLIVDDVEVDTKKMILNK